VINLLASKIGFGTCIFHLKYSFTFKQYFFCFWRTFLLYGLNMMTPAWFRLLLRLSTSSKGSYHYLHSFNYIFRFTSLHVYITTMAQRHRHGNYQQKHTHVKWHALVYSG